MSEQQLELYVKNLSDDFEFFCQELWIAVGLPGLAQHQREIANWLQHGPKRRGVRAFRGASKTWVTLGYCAWRFFNDPNTRILLVSKSEKHSRDSLFMLRRWIGSVPFLQHLAPDKKSNQRDSATKFDVGPAENDRVASFTGTGLQNQITGLRSSLIICDDGESSENCLTVEQRERLRDRCRELENIILPGPEHHLVYLGTPHSPESLYTSLAEGGYTFRAWPARYPTAEEQIDDLSPTLQERMDRGQAKPGDPVWPERFTDQDLLEREAAEGRSAFSMQYQLLTKLGEGLEYPLKLSDLIVFACHKDQAPLTISWGQTNDRGGTTSIEDIASAGLGTDRFYAPIMYSNEWRKFTGCKMWIDPSGGGSQGDLTGYAVVAHLNGQLYCKACGGLEGGYSTQTLNGLSMIAREHRVREILIESQFGAGMMAELLRPILQRHFIPAGNEDCPDGWGATIDNVRVTGQKELRVIGALEPLFNSHKLVIDPSVARNMDLQKQITRITKQRRCLKNDDMVEALAMCCSQWQDVLSRDSDKAADNLIESEMNERIKKHYEAMGLMTSHGPNWITNR